MYRRRFGIRFLAFGLLFICAMALFRAGVAHGYMMAASGIEGAVVNPHFAMGHFRPVGFGFAPVVFGFVLIMFGLMVLGRRSHYHSWRHHGPERGKSRRPRHPYPGWWCWDWYDEEEGPSSPADRDKGEPAEAKV